MTRDEKIKLLQKNIQQTIVLTGEEEGKYNCEIKDYYYKNPITGKERLEYSNIYTHYGHWEIMKKHFPFRVTYAFNNKTKEWGFASYNEKTDDYNEIPWCDISNDVIDELLAVKNVPTFRTKEYIEKSLSQQYKEHWEKEHSAMTDTNTDHIKFGKRPVRMCLKRIGGMLLAIPAALLLWLPFSLVEWIATGKNERADRMMFNIEKLAK